MHKGFHRWKEQLLLLFFPHKASYVGRYYPDQAGCVSTVPFLKQKISV